MKRSELRENIIKTAAELFYRNGYNSTGINEIIHESGIAKATLYNHFKSKEELCLSYLEYMNEVFLRNIKEFCYSKKESKSRILLIFDFLEEFYKDSNFNGCWCLKTVAEIPMDNKKIRKEIQRQKGQFIKFIEDLTEINFRGKTPQQRSSKVRQIYLLYESAVGESHLHQMSWPIKEARSMCSLIT